MSAALVLPDNTHWIIVHLEGDTYAVDAPATAYGPDEPMELESLLDGTGGTPVISRLMTGTIRECCDFVTWVGEGCP